MGFGRRAQSDSLAHAPGVRAGIAIVLRALEAPIRQIVENTGVEGSILVLPRRFLRRLAKAFKLEPSRPPGSVLTPVLL
jgi:hypothetical protein